MRVGADIIHPLVYKRFSGEALGYANRLYVYQSSDINTAA